MVYSPEGLGGLSERCHRLIGERILPPRFREKERPVLVNNWEATYFDFDEEKLCGLADSAAELGAELFVLDDGWFGERDSADRSLGDWQVNRRKLPGGLEGLAEHVRSRGMEFGLWVEPEMISRESELYRRRPDWCLHIPGRKPPEGRSQLMLDLTRREVREHLIGVLIGLLDAAPVSYVKWDMNRPRAGASSPTLPARHRGEVHHRYLLGLYEVLEKVTAARPEVLFEGCAGGGGRFDMGMLYYMPQYWSSDNTDAVSRLTIQYGTSILYPPVTMGAHVSAVPNHQTGRTVPLSFRGNAAMSGNLGYELDPAALTPAERLEVQEQIAFYTRHRRLIQFGRFIRLAGPAEHGETAWMFVDEDQREALVFRFIIRREANEPLRRLPLAGLDPDAVYADQDSGRRCRGDELMHRGLHPPAEPAEPTESAGEYLSLRIFLQAE
jgi:alpha-galactosidase